MHYAHGHAAWTSTCCCPFLCPCCMSMFIFQIYVHAAWRWPCIMHIGYGVDKYMLLVLFHVHAACLCPVCKSMSMLHVPVQAASPYPCFIYNVFAAFKYMLRVHVHAFFHGLLELCRVLSFKQLCWRPAKPVFTKPNI